MQVWLQKDADLGCPGDFSCIKTPYSSLFSNSMEAIQLRVLQFKSEFRQPFRHLHFWASSFSSVTSFPLCLHACTHVPRFPVVALHQNPPVVRQLWLSTPDPQLFLHLCYISTCWSSEKCPVRISPEKFKCHNKGICWISNLWHSTWFRKEPRAPIPWDLGATVQTPLSNTMQAALNLLLPVPKSVTGKH